MSTRKIKKLEMNFFFFVNFRDVNGTVKNDGTYRSFEGEKFDEQGFLIKNFPLHAIVGIISLEFFIDDLG